MRCSNPSGARSIKQNKWETPTLKSCIFDVGQAVLRQSKAGSVLQFFEPPTEMPEAVACHLTTVNPGLPAHTLHEHHLEELVIVKAEKITVLFNTELTVGAGSLALMASSEHHGIRNTKQAAAMYYLIRWCTKQ